MTRRSLVSVAAAALFLAAGVAAAAADVFQENGLDRKAWSGSFLSSLKDGALYAPSFPAKLKAVPAGRRAAVVKALGEAAKAWVGTADFRASWEREREASLPADMRPPRTAAEIEAAMSADLEKGMAESEAAVKELKGEARKQAEAAMAQMRAEMKKQAASFHKAAVEQSAAEKARYEAAKKRPPDPGALPADPQVALRKSLNVFLAETSGVDFAAELRAGSSGTRRFVRADYERKPRAWKLCYRAGREACEAARSFATGWLAELR